MVYVNFQCHQWTTTLKGKTKKRKKFDNYDDQSFGHLIFKFDMVVFKFSLFELNPFTLPCVLQDKSVQKLKKKKNQSLPLM